MINVNTTVSFRYIDRGFITSHMKSCEMVHVHSGMVFARIHELRGRGSITAEMATIEDKLQGSGRSKGAKSCTTRAGRIMLSVKEVKALFPENGWLPRTTFMRECCCNTGKLGTPKKSSFKKV